MAQGDEDALGHDLGSGKSPGEFRRGVEVAMVPAVKQGVEVLLGSVEIDDHGVFVKRLAGEVGADEPVVSVRRFKGSVGQSDMVHGVEAGFDGDGVHGPSHHMGVERRSTEEGAASQ